MEEQHFEKEQQNSTEEFKELRGSKNVDIGLVRPGRYKSDCWRWFVSIALYASALVLGMAISVLGPTLEDLASNVNKSISNLSYIFVGRSAGYAGGSLLGGILFDIVSPHMLLGGNVLILDTWGEQAGPHLQAFHFSFAAGAFVSPIIAKLLFGHKPGKNASADATTMSENSSSTILPFSHPTRSFPTSMWAYVVIGVFVLLVSLSFFILYFRSPPISSRKKTANGKQVFSKRHNTLIFLLSMFFFFYVGSEVAYSSFIFTYAKDYAGMDQARAAGLNSLFWGTFAVGRGLAIFIAACLRPGTLILLCLVGTTVSSLLLLLFSRNDPVLWTCTALLGISMSTIFPSGISWVEQYTTVTGRSAAVFVVGAALGEMVLPALVGFLLGHVQNQPLLMYLAFGTSVFTSVLFPVMYKIISRERATGKSNQGDSEYSQSPQDNTEEPNNEKKAEYKDSYDSSLKKSAA
ncbi:sodium-dependent glucose transporter 1 [Triplophysa rosa]|uniref:Sodium-dependent glucose transporter 1 n=1 Tax=Triplophysa rosa TaxID=992332 RepID=A0A9W7TLQ3_TRIRA|nr:sodium-dependent glucose transporter 1 [Triplophysa rosa]